MIQALEGKLNSGEGHEQSPIPIVNVGVHKQDTIKLWVQDSEKTYILKE